MLSPILFARPALRNPDFRKSCENMPESHTYSLWGFLGPRRDCSVDWASAKSGRERGGFCFPVRGKILSLLGGTAMHAAAACGAGRKGGIKGTALAGGSDMEGNE